MSKIDIHLIVYSFIHSFIHLFISYHQHLQKIWGCRPGRVAGWSKNLSGHVLGVCRWTSYEMLNAGLRNHQSFAQLLVPCDLRVVHHFMVLLQGFTRLAAAGGRTWIHHFVHWLRLSLFPTHGCLNGISLEHGGSGSLCRRADSRPVCICVNVGWKGHSLLLGLKNRNHTFIIERHRCEWLLFEGDVLATMCFRNWKPSWPLALPSCFSWVLSRSWKMCTEHHWWGTISTTNRALAWIHQNSEITRFLHNLPCACDNMWQEAQDVSQLLQGTSFLSA